MHFKFFMYWLHNRMNIFWVFLNGIVEIKAYKLHRCLIYNYWVLSFIFLFWKRCSYSELFWETSFIFYSEQVETAVFARNKALYIRHLDLILNFQGSLRKNMDVSFFFSFLEFSSADIIVLMLSLFSKNLYLIHGVIAKIFQGGLNKKENNWIFVIYFLFLYLMNSIYSPNDS